LVTVPMSVIVRVLQQMPSILESMQKLHSERWEQLLSVLKFYASALGALPAAVDDAVSKLKEQFETNASLDEDLEEFVNDAKTKSSAAASGEPLTFEAHTFFAAAGTVAAAAAADTPAPASTSSTPAPAVATPAPATTPAAAPAAAASDAPPL
jgi:hypothetical protein